MKKRQNDFRSIADCDSGLTLVAADHIDAPSVAGTATDITDMYTFQGQETANLVFAVNTQGLQVKCYSGRSL
jgi:hypothetical protein